MPKSALPDHLKDFDWQGTDNSSWLMQQKKKIQTWLAAGPRASGFWKWREFPISLFACRGNGAFRLETSNGGMHFAHYAANPVITKRWNRLRGFIPMPFAYLSRIQPWCRWHISLQWPLFFNCHIIYKSKNIVKPLKYQSEFGITKMFTFGIGFKRDGDKVYWLTANVGGNFE